MANSRFSVSDKQTVHYNNDMIVYHDDINNVTCYVYHGGNGNAMCCIPDHQLKEPKV